MSSRLKPPPLPIEVLGRVVRLAGTDGRLVLWLSGCFALIGAAAHNAIGAIAGCAAAGAGAIEVHGATLLRQGEPRGVAWLVRAQMLLLVTILIYCAARLGTFDPQLINAHITPDIQDRISEAGMTRQQFIEFLRSLYTLTYIVVGVVSLFYQGAMIRYYAARRTTIEQALHDRSA